MSVNRIFGANSVNGTGAGALNDISKLALTDGDIAVAKDNTLDSIHFYRYDSASTELADVYPTIIRPSDVVGAGVWYMISPQYFMENLIVDASSKILVNEIVGNGSGLSLGYQDGAIDIVVGTTEIAITKDITTDSQFISTLATGTPPIVVASTTMSTNLTAQYIGDVGGDSTDFAGVVITDGTHPFTGAVNGVSTDFDAIAGDLDGELATKPYIDYLLDQPNQISHGDLEDLLVDDHTQYSLVVGTRGYTGIPRVTNATTVFPSATNHLTTKKYVDDEITALGLGGGGSYLLRDGTNTATAVLSYDAGVTPAGANDITDVEYVQGLFTTHTSGGDPHTEYLLADGTRTTTGRLHTDVADSLATTAHTDYTYIVRSDIDFWMEAIHQTSGVNAQNFYKDAGGIDYLSNIVRRDYPSSISAYTSSWAEQSVNNLVTYGYLYDRLGGLLRVTETLGYVIDIAVTSTGTGGFTAGTNAVYTTTPLVASGNGLTVRAFADDNGDISRISVVNSGSAYVAADTVEIVGGNNDTVVTISKVFTEGALHGNLGELSLDQHPQYSLVNGTRAFTDPVAGVSSTSVGGDQDGELATRLWVQDYTSGSGAGTLDHDGDILNVASSTAHDNYMYVDPVTSPRGFEGVPYLDSITFPDPAAAIINSNDLATKGYIDNTIGNDFVKVDGSNNLQNNQIYNPQIPHDYFLDKADGSELINKDYVDGYFGLSLVSDADEYMGYFSESFVSENPSGTLINDGSLTGIELNIDSALKGTISRAVVNDGDGSVTKFFVYDGRAVGYPDTFPVWLDGSLSATNLTEKYIIPLSNETNRGTGAGLILSVVTAGVLVGDDASGDTTLDNAGYGYTALDDIALDGGTGTGAILHVITVDSRGAILTYNFSGGSGSGGTGYTTADELTCPNANAPISVVRGDILGFEIISESGTLTNGVHAFEVSGDGDSAFWTVSVVGGSITQFNRTAVAGSPYTNTGTSLPMTQTDIPTILAGSLSIQPYVYGEVVDIDVVEDGHGYTSATYSYTLGAGGFVVGGYDTAGATTLDIDYLNPLDEKVEVMHYEKGTLATNVNPKVLNYVVTPGNIISGILFDDFGHVQDITEGGSPSGVWTIIDETDSPVSTDVNTNYFANTDTAVIEMRLPATPVLGTSIIIDDYNANSSVYNITVKNDAGGTPLIEGASSDLIIDVDGSRVYLTYVDGTFGWRYKVI